jgi:membrane protease YdiL (CAAX protease family)
VHLAKFNFMLIMAAAVAGFIWGLAYRFFPERLGALIISHALWDCAVFIWLPI